MQLVNHDMDDLFRKAAENYPLQTDAADWKKIQEALSATSLQKPGKKRRRFLLLLLLIPFALIGNYLVQKEEGDTGGKKTAVQHKVDRSSKSTVPSHNKTAITSTNNNRAEAAEIQTMTEQLNSSSKPAQHVQATNKSAFQTKKANPHFADTTTLKAKLQLSQVKYFDASANLFPNKKLQTSNVEVNVENFGTTHIAARHSYPLFSLSANAVHKKIVTRELPTTPNTKAVHKKFYAGLSLAVEANTIKLQRVKNAGYNAGIVLGYRFANRWSVETGISFNKKSYYTDGRYFNTAKLYLPPNTSITSAEGFCTMWELPIQLRYAFKNQHRHQWFVAAGSSSYFMKSEDYDLGYYYQQNNRTVIHNRKYNTAYTHMFAVLSLSGGYSKSINKIGSLGVEPYFKIPLKSMGTGGLYLQTAGLRFTLTRDLF